MTGGAEAIIMVMALVALAALVGSALVGIVTRLVRGVEPEPEPEAGRRNWFGRRRRRQR